MQVHYYIALVIFTPFVFAQNTPKQQKLLQERTKLMAQYRSKFELDHKKRQLDQVLQKLAKALPYNGLQTKGINEYRTLILAKGLKSEDYLQFDKNGVPYHTRGDWDCDGKIDHAFLLRQPSETLGILLGNGKAYRYPIESADGIFVGKKGKYKTLKGQGLSDNFRQPDKFEAECDYIDVHYFISGDRGAIVLSKKDQNLYLYWTHTGDR